ncbi:MAG: hypothetical protein J6O71_06240 [Lachnospiraceae bacterium]|nr:hypothetical protein [Lachnospiraceae bacterium]
MSCKLRLIRNLILLGLPLLFMMVYLALKPMDYLTLEYPMWAEEKQLVTGKGEQVRDYDRLIIGDSRAKSGVMPAVLDESGNTYNIAIGGCTPIEMYYALDRYLKAHEPPKSVFIIFAPYHFYDIDNYNQTLYYNYLSVGQIVETAKEARGLMGEEKVAYKGWITDVISYKLRFPSKYLAAFYESLPGGNGEANRERLAQVRDELGFTLFGTEESNNEPSYEVHEEAFKRSELLIKYFERLLDRLQEEGVEVTIEQGPLNPVSYDSIKPEFIDGYMEFLDQISERYPEITVVKELPRYEADCFGDNNHLNRRGALKFTEALKERYNL